MKKKVLVLGNKLLRTVSKDVVLFDSYLHKLLQDMKDTLKPLDGVGLAAVQIGVGLNVLVIDFEGEFIEAVNPVIVSKEGVSDSIEGCFSIPGVSQSIVRAETLVIKYQSRNGNNNECEFTGRLAQIWQHEIDHLNGVLFIDHLSSTKRKKLLGRYKSKK